MDHKTTIAFQIKTDESSPDDFSQGIGELIKYIQTHSKMLSHSSGLRNGEIIDLESIMSFLNTLQDHASKLSADEDRLVNISELGLSNKTIDLEDGEIEFTESFCTYPDGNGFVVFMNNEEWYADELSFSNIPECISVVINDIDGNYSEFYP